MGDQSAEPQGSWLVIRLVAGGGGQRMNRQRVALFHEIAPFQTKNYSPNNPRESPGGRASCAMLVKVPRWSISCAARRMAPSATRARPPPKLTRATPRLASSGMVGVRGLARILIGPLMALARAAMVSASLAPIGKTQSAPAAR